MITASTPHNIDKALLLGVSSNMASLRAKVLSKAPLLVLGTVTTASGYAIYYAHHQQKVDKEVRPVQSFLSFVDIVNSGVSVFCRLCSLCATACCATSGATARSVSSNNSSESMASSRVNTSARARADIHPHR